MVNKIYENNFGLGYKNETWYQEFQKKIPKNTTHNVPKSFMLIKFKQELSLKEREDLANGLKNYLKSDKSFIIDVPLLIQST